METQKKQVRITFRMEAYIEGSSIEEIKSKFENTPINQLGADFVDICSIEDASNLSDLTDEWNQLY